MHLVCSAYQLSLGKNINTKLLGKNLDGYYKKNLKYLSSINKTSRRLILFRIQGAIDPSIYDYKRREEDFVRDSTFRFNEVNEYLVEVIAPIEVLFSEWEVLGDLTNYLENFYNQVF